MGPNTKAQNRDGSFRVLLTLACVIIIVAGLKMAAAICVPIVMGLFLAVLSLPILRFLNLKCRIPRTLAVAFTILIDLLILSTIIYVLSGGLGSVVKQSPEYVKKLHSKASSFSNTIDAQLKRLENWGTGTENKPSVDSSSEIPKPSVIDPTILPEDITNPEESERRRLPTLNEMLQEYWSTDRVLELINQTSIVERFTSLTSQSFFVLILVIFVLAESQRYAGKAKLVIRGRGPDLMRFQNSSQDIQRYLLLKTVVSLLTGLLAWICCELAKVEFALLWGVVAFLLNFIPVIGSILAAIPPVIIALIMQGFWPAAIVFLCYLAINICIGNFLEPKLLGDSFGISTVVVILSVLIWGYIWGPVGMFLAVPLTMMVKVMLDNTPELRWISVMMGSGKDDELNETELRAWQVRKRAKRKSRV